MTDDEIRIMTLEKMLDQEQIAHVLNDTDFGRRYRRFTRLDVCRISRAPSIAQTLRVTPCTRKNRSDSAPDERWGMRVRSEHGKS